MNTHDLLVAELLSRPEVKQEILRLVREVADKDKVDPVNSQGDMITLFPEELMRLIDRVQAQEREACAKLCDAQVDSAYGQGALICAEEIRARGEVK